MISVKNHTIIVQGWGVCKLSCDACAKPTLRCTTVFMVIELDVGFNGDTYCIILKQG